MVAWSGLNVRRFLYEVSNSGVSGLSNRVAPRTSGVLSAHFRLRHVLKKILVHMLRRKRPSPVPQHTRHRLRSDTATSADSESVIAVARSREARAKPDGQTPPGGGTATDSEFACQSHAMSDNRAVRRAWEFARRKGARQTGRCQGRERARLAYWPALHDNCPRLLRAVRCLRPDAATLRAARLTGSHPDAN